MEKLNETEKGKAVRQITKSILKEYGVLPSFVDPVGLKAYIEKTAGEQYDEMIKEREQQCEPVCLIIDMTACALILSAGFDAPDLLFGKTKAGNWAIINDD